MARNATVPQLRKFLMGDNGWTSEEFRLFLDKHADLVNGDATTANYDTWEDLAMRFDG